MTKNIALGILGLIIVLLGWYVYSLRLEVAAAEQANIDCKKRYQQVTDSLNAQPFPDAAPVIGLDAVARKKLRNKGFENPEQEIIANLLQQDLDIPVSGVLGGKMQIHEARLLNEQWALAYIEDGHIAGELLLEFKITEGKKIYWEVLSSMVK